LLVLSVVNFGIGAFLLTLKREAVIAAKIYLILSAIATAAIFLSTPEMEKVTGSIVIWSILIISVYVFWFALSNKWVKAYMHHKYEA